MNKPIVTKRDRRGIPVQWELNGVSVRRCKSGELSEAFSQEKYCTVDGKWMGKTIAQVVSVCLATSGAQEVK